MWEGVLLCRMRRARPMSEKIERVELDGGFMLKKGDKTLYHCECGYQTFNEHGYKLHKEQFKETGEEGEKNDE
jgi:hypothetical protein